LDIDCVQRHPRQHVLLYIFWALFYEVKNGRVFSMLDKELRIYELQNMDMNFKTYDLYSLIILSKLVSAKNPTFS
jgi:hypothetical protein